MSGNVGPHLPCDEVILKIILLSALLACTCGIATVSANDGAFMARLAYPESEVIQTATGDLDADGRLDLVALIHEHPSQSTYIRLVIFRGTPNGFEVWGRSGDLWFPKTGPSVEIKRGSLFMSVSGTTCCSAGWQNLQFKYRDGRFRLIGVSVGETKGSDGEPRAMDDEMRMDVDLNLLTGERHEKREMKGRKPQFRNSRATVPAPIMLEEFQGLDGELLQILEPTIN